MDGWILKNCQDSLPYAVLTDCADSADGEMDNFGLIDEDGWKALFPVCAGTVDVYTCKFRQKYYKAVCFIPCYK